MRASDVKTIEKTRKTKKKPKRPAERRPKPSRKPKKNKKNKDPGEISFDRGLAGCHSVPSLWFFWFFLVFSMVLASSQLGPLVFFGFSGFLNGFASNSPTWFGWCAESFSHRFPDVYMFPHVKGLGTFIFICFGCCDRLSVSEESYKTVVGETRVRPYMYIYIYTTHQKYQRGLTYVLQSQIA